MTPAERSRLEALVNGWPNDNGDPPDTEYQRGYMAACRDCADELAAELAGAGEETDRLQEADIFALLCRKYVQRADDRQKAMGLQYMEAETHDLAREIAALLNTSPAPVKASRAVADGAAACDCCDGRGEVGGLLLDGGGYQTDPCPYCDGTGIQPAPPLLDPAVVAELERLSARIASVDWTFEEHVDCILFIETATEPLHERVGIAQIGFDPEQRLPAETIAKLIVTMRNNLPAILAALRQGTAPAAVTEAMVEAAGTAFAHYCGGYDSSMRAAILAALQAQRGE